MIRTKKEAEKVFNSINNQHYIHTCDFCHTELVLEHKDVEKILFEPRDVSKDVVKFKCPYCGHIIETNYQELLKHTCSADGKQHMIFILDEEETLAARKFIIEHDHSEELIKKKGNPFFSALGQQFTYGITPGGLGESIVIKCNYCKDAKDITSD